MAILVLQFPRPVTDELKGISSCVVKAKHNINTHLEIWISLRFWMYLWRVIALTLLYACFVLHQTEDSIFHIQVILPHTCGEETAFWKFSFVIFQDNDRDQKYTLYISFHITCTNIYNILWKCKRHKYISIYLYKYKYQNMFMKFHRSQRNFTDLFLEFFLSLGLTRW